MVSTKKKYVLMTMITLLYVGLFGGFSFAAEKITLKIPVMTGPRHYDSWNATKAPFEKAHPNIKVQLEKMSEGEYYDKMPIELAAGSDRYDTFVIDDSYIVPWVYAGWITSLDEFINDPPSPFTDGDLDLGDVPPSVRYMYIFDGKIWGMAHDSNAYISYWRKDVFEEYGIPDPIDITLGTSLDIMRQLTRDLNGDGRIDQYGFTGSWIRGGYLPTAWSTFMAQAGARMWDEDSNPTLNTPEGRRGMEWMKLILDNYATPGTANQGHPGEVKDLTTGLAVFAPYTWSIEIMVNPDKNPYANVTGTTSPPTSIYPKPGDIAGFFPATKNPEVKLKGIMGGFGTVINNFISQERKIASWEWAEFLQSKKNGRNFVAAGGQPGRISLLTDPENIKRQPQLKALAETLPGAVHRPPIREFLDLQSVISENTSLALMGDLSIEDSLKRMEKEFTRIFKKSGRLK